MRLTSLDDRIARLSEESRGSHKLKRILNLRSIVLIGVGSMIGPGILVALGSATARAGTDVVWSLLVAAGVGLCAAFCYAALSSLVPIAGSAYTYAYATLGEYPAWLSGCVTLLAQGSTVVVAAIGLSHYAVRALDAVFGFIVPRELATSPFAGGILDLPALLATCLIGALLLQGSRESITVNSLTTGIKLCAVAFFVAIGLVHGTHLTLASFLPKNVGDVRDAAALLIIAFIGFENIASTAEEAKNPKREIPLGMFISFAIVLAVSVIVAITLLMLVPDVHVLADSASPLADALLNVGRSVVGVLSASAVIGLLGGLLPSLYGATRVIFRMGRDGLLPAWASYINPRTRTPTYGTVLTVCVIAVASAVMPWHLALQYANISVLLDFIVVAVCVLMFHWRPIARSFSFRIPVAVPMLAILGSIFLLVSFGRSTVELLSALVVVAIPGTIVYVGYGRTHSVKAVEERSSVVLSAVSDAPVYIDRLGFTPYVKAVAAFLRNKDTQPPLTISVEGEWGSGKSSFLLQLARELQSWSSATKIVRFNAWIHDRDVSLWSAFVLSFIEQVSPDWRWIAPRLWLNMKLWACRYDWQSGALQIALWALSWLVLIASTVYCVMNWDKVKHYTPDSFGSATVATGGLFSYILLLVYAAKKSKEWFGNPLRLDIEKYSRQPPYEKSVAFAETLQRDFQRVLSVLSETEKIYVFIDDLDRCEPPRAADLMQAINMLTSIESQKLVFIVAMDRTKVASAIASRFTELLPYLYPGIQDREMGATGLRFGYDFVEKFVQLSFRLPALKAENIKNVVGKNENGGGGAGRHDVQDLSSDEMRELDKDLYAMHAVIALVSPALDLNPRRVKHFVNAFRLAGYIADRQALFESQNGRLTLQVLAKVIAILSRWPTIRNDLTDDPGLLQELYHISMGSRLEADASEPGKKWAREKKLMDLLKADSGTRDERFDVKDILTIASFSVRPNGPAQPSSA